MAIIGGLILMSVYKYGCSSAHVNIDKVSVAKRISFRTFIVLNNRTARYKINTP